MKNPKRILDALNTLAVSLTNYSHKWSREERNLYNYAARELEKESGFLNETNG